MGERMTWFRVDDGFPEHPKLEELEREPRLYMAAITVWTIMGADCARRLTDGFVSSARLEKVLHRLGKSAADGAKALVACGLWTAVDGGWMYHDWADYQPTKADVDASRKAKTERQRRWRGTRVDASTDKSTPASVDDAPARVSRPSPSRPNQEEDSPKGESPSDSAAGLASRIRELESRYAEGLAAEARKACAMSRRNGRMSDSLWATTLEAMAKHPADAVERSMRTFAERYADGQKDERYLLGIVRGEARPSRPLPAPANGNGGRMPRAAATTHLDFANEPSVQEQIAGWANG